MYGLYENIISVAEKAVLDLPKTAELLEYPEVQADKNYYLSVMNNYNRLCVLQKSLNELKGALNGIDEARQMLKGLTEQEQSALFEEISVLQKQVSMSSAKLSEMLGCKNVSRKVSCKVKTAGFAAIRVGELLLSCIKKDVDLFGGKMQKPEWKFDKNRQNATASFVVEGVEAFHRLYVLCGSHRVLTDAVAEELSVAVVQLSEPFSGIDEKDIRIDLFHSGGAGGQNINKVETAVRVTHIPTNTVVVCQDERSQLANKKRALQTLEKRLSDKFDAEENLRADAEAARQLVQKNAQPQFDCRKNTVTDLRLKNYADIPFQQMQACFSDYLNALIAIGN